MVQLWEQKWREFVKTEALHRHSKSGEFPHGKAIYRRLPQYLYHMTLKSTFDEISKQGYLGFSYREHNPNLDSRGWQKAGWGVFFGTNPEACETYMTSTIDRGEPLVCLKVDKDKLDPEKFYVDDDVMGDYEDFDEIDMEDISVFYADKVPLSYVTVVGIDEKPDFSSFSSSRESKMKGIRRSREFIEEKLQQCFSEPLKFQHPTKEALKSGYVDISNTLVLIDFTLVEGRLKCRGFKVVLNKSSKRYEVLAYLPDKCFDAGMGRLYDKAREELQKIFKPFCDSVKASVYVGKYSQFEWDKSKYC